MEEDPRFMQESEAGRGGEAQLVVPERRKQLDFLWPNINEQVVRSVLTAQYYYMIKIALHVISRMHRS